VFYAGIVVIHTSKGDLYCTDAGTPQTTGSGPFSSVCVVTGGTGRFADATGCVHEVGTFVAGRGTGEYQGQIVRQR
jgi:hypothetical protein